MKKNETAKEKENKIVEVFRYLFCLPVMSWKQWTKEDSKDIALWILIAIFSTVLLFLLKQSWLLWFPCVVIYLSKPYKLKAESFLTIFGILTVAANLSLQTTAVSLQTKSLKFQNRSLALQNRSLKNQLVQDRLKSRPYLFVDFSYALGPRENDLLFGPNMTFVNYGSYPASFFKAEYIVCDDKDCPDLKQWYKNTNHSGYPEISIVPPGKTTEPYIPGIRKDSEVGYIGVLISYFGLDKNQKYWFKRLEKFKIIRDGAGNPINLLPLERDMDWDRNGGENLNQPAWTQGTIFYDKIESAIKKLEV